MAGKIGEHLDRWPLPGALLLVMLLFLSVSHSRAASPFDPDTDGDGVADSTDNCPLVPYADQANSDLDKSGDSCDCAPLKPGVSAAASPVGASVRLQGNSATAITWAQGAQGHVSSVYRGHRDPGQPWSYNETCFVAATPATAAVDSSIPAPGQLFYYLVSGLNSCGESSNGADSQGIEHFPASACPAGYADSDGDGVADLDDNCPSTANIGLADSDHDFIGDACDTCLLDPSNDADGDGICATTEGPQFPWDETMVYVLIEDKFDDADPGNDYMIQEFNLPNPSYSGGYRGGDLQGVLDHLDYLRSLGLNTILLYPPFANDREPFFQYLASGYRVTDWQDVDRNLGTKAQLKSVVDSLHSGSPAMRLIIDLPIGMSGQENPWNTEQLSYVDYFRPWGTENIGDSPDMTAYGPVDNSYGMPINNHLKGRETRSEVYGHFLDRVMIWLPEEYGADGLRYDSVQNFYSDFWSYSLNQFRKDVNRFRPDFDHFGEMIWLGPLYSWQLPDPDYVNSASSSRIRMNGIYDFAMISDIKNVFAKSQNTQLLVFNHDSKNAQFEDPKALSASVDNYESDTFLAAVPDGNGKARLKLALSFLFSVDRIPFVYSGNEYAMDYSQPGALFQPGQDEQFHQWFKNLVQIRKSHSSLTHGSFTWLTNNPSYLSFGRVQGSDKIITALNISSIADRQQKLPIGSKGINCSSVTNLFDSSDQRNKLTGSGANQTLTVTHDPWEAKTLLCQ